MDFIESVFKRIDLQQITSFLLDGAEYFEIENSTYKERLETGSAEIYKRLEQLYPDEYQLDKAVR